MQVKISSYEKGLFGGKKHFIVNISSHIYHQAMKTEEWKLFSIFFGTEFGFSYLFVLVAVFFLLSEPIMAKEQPSLLFMQLTGTVITFRQHIF